MKRIVRYILLFLIVIIAFLGYFIISYTLPVYHYESSDGQFDDIEVPWKGRTLKTVEINFENYKQGKDNPDLKLFRTSKRIWYASNLWIDNLTNRRWNIPFAEPSSNLSNQNPTKTKRAEPKAVAPVTYSGIRYIAPHFKITDKQAQRGFVEAWDIKTNKMLWDILVYETKYESNLEHDVQDVFITSMKIEHDKLVITNERNEIYAVSLKARNVERIK